MSNTRVGLAAAISPSSKESLAWQVSWLTFAKIIGFVFSIALPLLLVRRMDREQYGLYKQAFLVITTAMVVLPMGVPMSAFYFLSREKTRRRQTVLNIVVFHVLVGAIACTAIATFPSILAAIFHHARLERFAVWIGITIFFWITGSFLDMAPVANDEIRLASKLIVGIQASRATLFVGALLVFGTLRSLLIAALLHGLVQTLVLFCYLQSRFAGFLSAFNWSMMREQLSYALPLGGAAVLLMVQTDLHNYFVSNHFGPAMFGVYAIGTVQLPLIGLIWEATNSILITRVSILQKSGGHRQIVLLLARAARKLSMVYFALFAFLIVAGRECLRVLFTARFADAWPIFAINLAFLPMGILLLDPLFRAFEGERYFLLRLRIALAAILILSLWLFTARSGLTGVVAIVVLAVAIERAVMAIHFGRLLGVTTRDFALLRDVGKLAIAAVVAGLAAALVRAVLVGANAFVIVVACATTFICVYLPIVVRWLAIPLRVPLLAPFKSRATSAGVSSR